MKTDGRMDRCRLKGALGDALNAVLVAAGHNTRPLLRAMVALLGRLLHRLLVVIGAGIQDRDLAPLNAGRSVTGYSGRTTAP